MLSCSLDVFGEWSKDIFSGASDNVFAIEFNPFLSLKCCISHTAVSSFLVVTPSKYLIHIFHTEEEMVHSSTTVYIGVKFRSFWPKISDFRIWKFIFVCPLHL